MTDKYLPKLSAFLLSADEQATVNEALQKNDPWGWKPTEPKKTYLKDAKDKIRDYHLERHGHKCCYCRKNLFGEAKLSIDREHILPKGNPNYRHLSFTMWNLGASCKRCNMLYKGTDEGFIVAGHQSGNLNSSGCYSFIHPNFDLFKDHLGRRSEEVNDTTIVKYTVQNGSEKGEYTYDYFNLKGLEIGSFDTAQGHKSSFAIGDLGMKVRSLAQRFFRPA